MRILLMLMLMGALFAEAHERLGIDPILRGVWRVHALSKDEGKTVDKVDPPIDLAVAKATSIRFSGGDVLRIEHVMIHEEEGQDPKNIAKLSNGNVLCFSKNPDQEFVLIQIYTPNGEGGIREKMRFLVTVE